MCVIVPAYTQRLYVTHVLTRTFISFISGIISKDFGGDAGLLQPPFVLNAIDGLPEGKWSDQFVPAYILICAVILQCFPGLFYLQEKKRGMLQRTFVTGGVTNHHVILSYMIYTIPVLTVQAGVMITIVSFGMENIQGSWGLVFLQMFFNGMAGAALGLFGCYFLTGELEAVLLAIAILMTIFLLSGSSWPLEGFNPSWYRYVGYLGPTTLPLEAIRSIMRRGWGIENSKVMAGFVASGIYGVGSLGIIFVLDKLRGLGRLENDVYYSNINEKGNGEKVDECRDEITKL